MKTFDQELSTDYHNQRLNTGRERTQQNPNPRMHNISTKIGKYAVQIYPHRSNATIPSSFNKDQTTRHPKVLKSSAKERQCPSQIFSHVILDYYRCLLKLGREPIISWINFSDSLLLKVPGAREMWEGLIIIIWW